MSGSVTYSTLFLLPELSNLKKRAKNEREEELILEGRKSVVEKNASHNSSLISSWNESSKNREAYKLDLILRITNCFSS